MSLPSTAQAVGSEWAVVDVETSGLRAAQSRVLSLAVVTLDPDGRQTGQYSTLLDPGCDPGPVHIHGLTRERLRGAPRFEDVAEHVAAMLVGRIMVAHNAQFDYDFLFREFASAGMVLPVRRRLCTLALNRKIGPPTADFKLGTLAAHYGVPQLRAHDALDDTLVLAGVLRGSLLSADRLGVLLPYVQCPPRRSPQLPPTIPKIKCTFLSPGPWTAGNPLVQGMKVAITGETDVPRIDLVTKAAAAGLNVMNSVSRHTSLLVTNDPLSGTGKAVRAHSAGVSIIDERAFLALLCDVRPGTPLDEKPAPAALSATVQTPLRPAPDTASKPLSGRRVLIIGGSHDDAAGARARAVDLGAAAAVNLSGKVTDVVVLPGGETDRRMTRITTLGLPVHEQSWLLGPTADPKPVALPQEDAFVLSRGAVIDLPVTENASVWTVAASWAQQTDCEVDVVAFVVDDNEQVSCDEDFVFYGAPEVPGGTVALSTDGPCDQAISVDVTALPGRVTRIVICAAIDGPATFGDVGAIEINAQQDSNGSYAQVTLDAATSERTVLLAEIYRRGDIWRLRAIGQGHDYGLDELARSYGVDIADE